MRADEEPEEARGGERVLFQAGQVPVAFVLLDPGPEEEGHGRGHARGEDARRIMCLPGFENGI